MYSCTTHIININQAGVGFYLHREGPNLGKNIVSLVSCYHPPRRTVRDPYPRSAGFDTDIGAFIESSSVSSLLGPMAPPIVSSDAVQGETFLPDKSSFLAASHCGPIRLATWSRSKAT